MMKAFYVHFVMNAVLLIKDNIHLKIFIKVKYLNVVVLSILNIQKLWKNLIYYLVAIY